MLTEICGPLRAALVRNRFTADGLVDLLGPDAHAALTRSESVPARRVARSAGELGTLVQLFLLADACAEDDVAAALAPLDLNLAVAAGLLERIGAQVRSALDLRPVDLGSGDRWIISDLDDAMAARSITADHVLGLGHASYSLLRATPTAPVGSVLDLGTGCGVQAVHAAGYAKRVTATDVNPRAIALAAATAALNELDIELLEGSWFEPVAGRRFDQVVANPPFVVGPARVEHTYRDSGLDLDGASRLVVSQAPQYLAEGGTAALLASWVHVAGEDWRSRVASWIPDEGIDAWVVQRDVADPALYVGTWLRDAGLDPRDEAAKDQAERWLDHFAAAGVNGIGFGYVFLRQIDGTSEVLAEELMHEYDHPLGDEALAYFERSAWLRDNDVLEASFAIEPDAALERIYQPGGDGWHEVATRLHRTTGPRWQHELDELATALVHGMRADGLSLHELVAVLAIAHTGEQPDAELLAAAKELAEALVRHGIVAPR